MKGIRTKRRHVAVVVNNNIGAIYNGDRSHVRPVLDYPVQIRKRRGFAPFARYGEHVNRPLKRESIGPLAYETWTGKFHERRERSSLAVVETRRVKTIFTKWFLPILPDVSLGHVAIKKESNSRGVFPFPKIALLTRVISGGERRSRNFV